MWFKAFDLVKNTQDVIEEKNYVWSLAVQLSLESKIKEIFVKGESMAFKRILSNLINNAFEASSPPATIRLSIGEVESHKIQLTIADGGKGISQDLLDRLGKEQVTDGKEGFGTGLGFLSSSQKMKEWGGNLEILSTSPNGTIIALQFKK